MSLDTRTRLLHLAHLIVLGFMLLWAANAAAVIKVTLVVSDATATYRDAAVYAWRGTPGDEDGCMPLPFRMAQASSFEWHGMTSRLHYRGEHP